LGSKAQPDRRTAALFSEAVTCCSGVSGAFSVTLVIQSVHSYVLHLQTTLDFLVSHMGVLNRIWKRWPWLLPLLIQ